jgi:hypothetical protein
MQMSHGGAASIGVRDPDGVRHTATTLRWPCIVLGEGTVHETRFATDDSEVRSHKRRDTEMLTKHRPVLGEHRPGIAGEELRLVPWEGATEVLEKARALP